jgi:3D (Asp-Asp-Asp) domain-containing protein
MAVQDYISLGEYKLTSYCACEKCCGYWATIRSLDEDGNPIVYTASGAIARQGVTVAADTDVLPFGTVLLIGGEEFIVQDVGGGVQGKQIDIYFEEHRAAVEFGVRYETIYREGNA